MAACTDSGPDYDGSYQLVSINGAEIEGEATLVIDGKAVAGQGPCNQYRGENNTDWPDVALGPLAVTRRACVREGGEAAFFAALQKVTTATRSDRSLTLSGSDADGTTHTSLLFTAD